ncbi:MAG: riboflavin synthase subunit alpha [Rhodothermaceae bacterium]|nr:MAG: riboflavin synthase subunit alpha [Rhodothermaceae bacterium]
MFTGIIEEVGEVVGVEPLGGGRRLRIAAAMAAALRPEQSVAVNGACLTVVRTGDGTFEVIAIEETLKKTTLGTFRPGRRVNLERALPATGRLDGHLVQGHVDAAGTVERVEPLATSTLYHLRFDARFAPYVIPTGSIAVDGISLTVARLEDDRLTVAIIPYTAEHTNTRTWTPGTRVNLEFDLLGKYVVRWLTLRGSAPARLSPEWLREQGF